MNKLNANCWLMNNKKQGNGGITMEFVSVIVDELGTIMYYRSTLTREQELDILEKHPEWSVKCVEV